jgi:hypothetical protein
VGEAGIFRHGRAVYAVPGIVSWSLVVLAVVGIVFFPSTWMLVSVCFLAYFVARMLLVLVFAVVGEVHRVRWERRDWSAREDTPAGQGVRPTDVRHMVVVPNYREPLDVLRRTLDALALQHRAAERLFVVLGMEERESGARAKGEMLASEYADSFARVHVTVHPPDLPGEVAGKGSNEAWAARHARDLLDEMGWDPELVTLTSCDADSLLHPTYFSALSALFAEHPKRHSAMWQAPLFYYNNMWEVPAPIRFTTWFGQIGQLAELAMPFYAAMPISTYTLSLRLAEDIGWWDTDVISEDWHVYLQCHFQRQGDMRLEPVFLPTSADCTGGPTWMRAMHNRFTQVMRHSWGAEDVGYMLREMSRRSDRSLRSVARCAQVLHDHVARVVTWFYVIGAYLLAVGAHPVYGGLTEGLGADLPGVRVLGSMFAIGAAALLTTIGIELWRNPPPPHTSLVKVALELAFMWALLPLTGLYLGTLPAMRAQTRLMLGRQLAFVVTPKRTGPDVPEPITESQAAAP